MRKKEAFNAFELVYSKLFNAYGPQHWWPSDTSDETIIGAILTQNVAWTNVEKALINLKNAKITTLKDLVNIQSNVLADLILPARFSRQKAVYLKETALFFKDYLFDIDFIKNKYSLQDLRKKILEVKGIGNETADTILLYALELPSFIIDAYTKRIFSRLGIAESETIPYHSLQEMFHHNLALDALYFNEYHALIVRHAKEHCTKRNPLCGMCPLNDICIKKII